MEAAFQCRIRHSFHGLAVSIANPHLLHADEIVLQMQAQFPDGVVNQCTWDGFRMALDRLPMWRLQLFSTWLWVHNKCYCSQGPQWVSQHARARAADALGHQRAASNNRRGMTHLLPPGLGPRMHIQAATRLTSPFSTPIERDEDTRVCAEAMAIMGPALPALRQQQLETLVDVARIVSAIDHELKLAMPPSVAKVANAKSPALIAFLSAILLWPDRHQASSYVFGVPIIGGIPTSGTFRPLKPHASPAP